MTDPGSFLRTPVQDLPFSQEFISRCVAMGHDTLEEILSLPPAELLQKKGFSYGWLAELTAVLQERELLHLLQTTSGKSPGRSGQPF